jgi:cytochrome c oxidase cbb3-type subunit 1
MIVSSPTVPGGAPVEYRISLEESDASARGPVTFLFGASLVWLLLSSFLGWLAAIKMHSPGFLADWSYISYGRLVPLQSVSFLYGFASQAALGVSLWLLCRLGRTTLLLPSVVGIGALVWNAGVLLGLVGISLGDASGYERLEMPGYSSLVLFVSYLAIASGALATFHWRRERESYPSVVYILGALFWFPWLLASAMLLLQLGGVRAAVQTVVNLWYANGVIMLWLGPISLAAIFYFLPKLSGKPLYSAPLASFAFWTLAFFGGMTGMNTHAALPSWFPALSSACSFLLLVTALALGFNWTRTLEGAKGRKDPAFYFVRTAGGCFLVSLVLAAIFAAPGARRVLLFTTYPLGVSALQLYGFVTLALLGTIYYALPRISLTVTSSEGPTLAYRLISAGAIIMTLGLVFAGVRQGRMLDHATIDFMRTVKASVPFVGFATLGWLVFMAGVATYVWSLRKSFACCCCAPGGGR